jgi:hypothetical protein
MSLFFTQVHNHILDVVREQWKLSLPVCVSGEVDPTVLSHVRAGQVPTSSDPITSGVRRKVFRLGVLQELPGMVQAAASKVGEGREETFLHTYFMQMHAYTTATWCSLAHAIDVSNQKHLSPLNCDSWVLS